MHSEVCVCEIVDVLRITQPSASKALGNLKSVGLLRDRRDANRVYYSLRDDLPAWVTTIIQTTVTELKGCKTCATDTRRFSHRVKRPGNAACQ